MAVSHGSSQTSVDSIEIQHPLDPLTADEITQAAEILLRLIADDPERVLRVRLHTEHQNRIVQTP